MNAPKAAETYTHTHTHTHTHGCLCKIIIPIIAIFATTIPSFAVDINANATSADCDNNTLHTTTGPATLTADWSANTINLEWYSDDTKLDVPAASNTCVYDGGITIPTTNPTKPGYEFAGWAVREVQQCSLSGLDASVNATWDAQHARWKPINGDSGRTMQSLFGTENSSDLNNGEWAVTFSYGTVKGVALCSSTNGKYANTGSPDESETGGNCWCKATGLAEPNSTEYCPVASSSWVVYGSYDNAGNCADGCAFICANGVQQNSDFRRAVYGQ